MHIVCEHKERLQGDRVGRRRNAKLEDQPTGQAGSGAKDRLDPGMNQPTPRRIESNLTSGDSHTSGLCDPRLFHLFWLFPGRATASECGRLVYVIAELLSGL